MQVVNYAQGLSVRRFPLEEVMPLSAVPYEQITDAVRERYSFMTVSASAEAQQVGLLTPSFENGRFSMDGASHAILSFEIGPENLRVMSSKTEISDAFIADVLIFAEGFGFRPQSIRKPPLYASTLLVELTEEEKALFSFLDRGSEILKDEFHLLGKQREVKPFGVRWITNDGSGPGSICVLEKRVGNETGEDIFFSQASLPTHSHERYLKRLFGHAESKA